MEQKSGKGLLILLTCLVVLSVLLSGIALNKKIKMVAEPDLTSINKNLVVLANNDVALGSKLDDLAIQVQTQSTSTAAGETETEVPTDRANQAYDKILTSEDEEDLAEKIATDYLSTKDFKKALVKFLNDNDVENQSIENYKDISNVVVKDVEVNLLRHSDNAKVIFEIKVSYFNDEDDDEEDIQKARVKVVLTVGDLDEDDDYADAEVVEGLEKFTLIKIYE